MAGSHALVFTYQGSQYAHTLNGGLKLYALSPERLAFSGSGSYSGGGTWTIRGQVDRGRVSATIAYDGQSYKVFMTGKVASDSVGLRHLFFRNEAGAHVHHARRVVRLGVVTHIAPISINMGGTTTRPSSSPSRPVSRGWPVPG